MEADSLISKHDESLDQVVAVLMHLRANYQRLYDLGNQNQILITQFGCFEPCQFANLKAKEML